MAKIQIISDKLMFLVCFFSIFVNMQGLLVPLYGTHVNKHKTT